MNLIKIHNIQAFSYTRICAVSYKKIINMYSLRVHLGQNNINNTKIMILPNKSVYCIYIYKLQ